MTEQIRYVIGVDIRRPEPRGEGMPEIVEVEITDPGLFDRLGSREAKHLIESAKLLRCNS
ncbi:MAG TPA: hypothetical protein VGN95_03155 [Pyrinomonadaceae bacterium]|nr:hypothetical protein [Pyrinomonadaceae bacterium]